jgi:UDP-N-acetylglucosamine 2-epimerase (non-hydrolysing)
MSDLFFRQLGIPEPDLNLGVGSGSHALQTAEIMKGFEPVLLEHRPDAVLVVGDVNSTIACGLVAVKLGIALLHVEAGLRSFDRSMPEEINRILTDSVSDLLFTTEPSANENLAREGVAGSRVHFVGNVMIDTLFRYRERAAASTILPRLGVEPGGYAALTLHRPSNVDDSAALGRLLDAVARIQAETPVVFPVHPRTQGRLAELGGRRPAMPGLILSDPLPYLEFVQLMANARCVLTDSGGIQEETTYLNVPCFTLRDNTERPVTIRAGTNTLLGLDPRRIGEIPDLLRERAAAGDGSKKSRTPELWDGRAAERIAEVLAGW